MKAEKLLEIWAESCKENDDCDRCFFAEICPLNMPIKTLTAKKFESFEESVEKRFGETIDLSAGRPGASKNR